MDLLRVIKSFGTRLGLSVMGVLLPALAFAAELPQFDKDKKIEATGLGTNNLTELVIEIIQWVLTVLGLIAIALIIYAGVLYLISAGNADQIKKAKGILQASIIGLLLILAAYGIASYVFNVSVNVTTSTK